jgi:hypothetical protein
LQLTDIEWLAVCSDLIRGSFEDLITTSFPLFRKFLKEEEFEEILTGFIKEEHPETLFLELARQFVDYFKRENFSAKVRTPFLEELLSHEWTEIELYNEKEEPLRSDKWNWDAPLKLSSSARLVCYEYPVHEAYELSREEILSLRGTYHLLIYRDARNYEIKTAQLTEFVYNFLRKLTSGANPDEALSHTFPSAELTRVKEYLGNFVRELIKVGVLF